MEFPAGAWQVQICPEDKGHAARDSSLSPREELLRAGIAAGPCLADTHHNSCCLLHSPDPRPQALSHTMADWKGCTIQPLPYVLCNPCTSPAQPSPPHQPGPSTPALQAWDSYHQLHLISAMSEPVPNPAILLRVPGPVWAQLLSWGKLKEHRFRLDFRKKRLTVNVCNLGTGCPENLLTSTVGSSQSQVGWGFQQHYLAEDVPSHHGGLELNGLLKSSATQNIPYFMKSPRSGPGMILGLPHTTLHTVHPPQIASD